MEQCLVVDKLSHWSKDHPAMFVLYLDFIMFNDVNSEPFHLSTLFYPLQLLLSAKST